MSETQQQITESSSANFLKKLKYIPSKKMDGLYVILQEFNDEECESWLYFLRLQGNEDALRKLQSQLEDIDWYVMDGQSTFDLDLDHPVSATTAKEMTKVELNAYSFHRKFDGKLKEINFEFKRKDSNKTKMCKVYDMLGYGQIEKFIDDEDLDEEDLISCDSDCEGYSDCSYSNSDSEYDRSSNSDNSYSSDSDSDNDKHNYKSNDKNKKSNNFKGKPLPPSISKLKRQ